jgi:hypothetical protein
MKENTHMHYLVKHSLLTSINTIRTVLNGMELLIKNSPDNEPANTKQAQQYAAVEQDNGLNDDDELILAKKLGLRREVDDGE